MPNTPYLDKSVRWRLATGNLAFHELRYREVAEAILDAGVADEVIRPIGSGKEADVLMGRDRGRLIAIKAYRYYRTSHTGLRPVRAEELGRVAAREFELLGYAFGARAPVPEPLEREEYLLTMELVGDADGPAPRLKDVRPDDPERLARAVLEGVEALARGGVVHTDLSPFNILVHQDRPWIIDLADGLRVDRLGSSPFERLTLAREALTKGFGNLARYFQRYGVALETAKLVERIVERWDRFGLMS